MFDNVFIYDSWVRSGSGGTCVIVAFLAHHQKAPKIQKDREKSETEASGRRSHFLRVKHKSLYISIL
jgi:hypothetical protein